MAAEDHEDDGASVPSSIRSRVSGAVDPVTKRAQQLRERNLLAAISFAAFDRNTRLAASVMAGGLAYRLFVWLLPFGLIVGGVLGFYDARSAEDAVQSGGLPAAVVDAVGDVARDAESSRWWLIVVGASLVAWAGYTGGKAVRQIHALIWSEPSLGATNPVRASLAFSGFSVAILATMALTSWLRREVDLAALVVVAACVAPLVVLWLLISLQLPHRDAPWQALLPGAALVGVGLQALNVVTFYFLLPKLENSSALYGSLGVAGTVLLWTYIAGRLVVTAPILNVTYFEERERLENTS
jgi:membrane protein